MKKDKKKILFRMRSMEMGGVQKVLLNILNNLDRNKFDINILLNLRQGELIKDIPSDVNVYSIGKGKDQMSINRYIKILQLIIRRIKLYYFNIFPTQIKYIIKKKIDVDIAFTDNLVDNLYRTKEYDVKKIAWIHGDLTKSVHSDYKKQKMVKQFMSMDKMIYVSKDTLKSTKTIINNADCNSQVIYNPIDVDNIILKSKEKVSFNISSVFTDGVFSFIFVGRIYETKGCNLLLKAHKRIIDEGINHKIYLIGEGDLTSELKYKIKESNLENTFLLLGEKENPYKYINLIDCLVLPSFSEGYPLVIAESLILETPVLCTNVGGINEMVNENENGLFIEYNEDSLYEGMKKIIENKDLFNRIIKNNKKCKIFFNPNKIYKEIENVFFNK